MQEIDSEFISSIQILPNPFNWEENVNFDLEKWHFPFQWSLCSGSGEWQLEFGDWERWKERKSVKLPSIMTPHIELRPS